MSGNNPPGGRERGYSNHTQRDRKRWRRADSECSMEGGSPERTALVAPRRCERDSRYRYDRSWTPARPHRTESARTWGDRWHRLLGDDPDQSGRYRGRVGTTSASTGPVHGHHPARSRRALDSRCTHQCWIDRHRHPWITLEFTRSTRFPIRDHASPIRTIPRNIRLLSGLTPRLCSGSERLP